MQVCRHILGITWIALGNLVLAVAGFVVAAWLGLVLLLVFLLPLVWLDPATTDLWPYLAEFIQASWPTIAVFVVIPGVAMVHLVGGVRLLQRRTASATIIRQMGWFRLGAAGWCAAVSPFAFLVMGDVGFAVALAVGAVAAVGWTVLERRVLARAEMVGEFGPDACPPAFAVGSKGGKQ